MSTRRPTLQSASRRIDRQSERAGQRPAQGARRRGDQHFGTIASSQRDHLSEDGIVSPDGRYIVKVTHRGVLPEGVTEGTIWLFETKAVLDYVNQPRRSRPEPGRRYPLVVQTHKLAHQELMVDWFEFWLADREHENAANADRYMRWRKLKEAQNAGS